MYKYDLDIRFDEWARREWAKRRPAKERGLNKCINCGYCCTKTCVPLPKELKLIAKYLNMTVKEMIDTYMVGDENDGYYFLRWANTAQTDLLGEFLPDDRTYDIGMCILFNETTRECKIYPVRPVDAREAGCWKKNDEYHTWSMRQWRRGILEHLCPDMIIDSWR